MANDEKQQQDAQAAEGQTRSRRRRPRGRRGGQGNRPNQEQQGQQDQQATQGGRGNDGNRQGDNTRTPDGNRKDPQRGNQRNQGSEGGQRGQQAAADDAQQGGQSRRPRRRRRPGGGQGQQQGENQQQTQPQQAQQQEQKQSSGGRGSGSGRGKGGQSGKSGDQRSSRGGQQGGRPAQDTQERQGQQRRQGRSPVRRPRREEEALERRPAPVRGHQGFSVIGPIGNDTLRVIPLGGVGEVGKNMTAVECGRDIVLLDAGGKFPEEDQRGIDLIIPDISFVRDRLKNFRGILITHGHEDHIGGLPHIVPQLIQKKGDKVPIWGTPLALGFIERKLMEARLEDMVELNAVHSGSKVTLGSMTAEFIRVTHSIPDATSIALHTPVGTILDTGDFKFDPTPVMGEPSDIKRFERIGRDGVLALLSDTVRVEVPGSTPSEQVVHDKISEEIGKSKGQVIIATFASNISRIHMALKAAEKHGRKVAVAGRSMEQNARVALDLGYLDPPEGLFLSLDEVLRLPKERRVIVSTGSQGEVAAALARIGAGEHPKIRVGRGDTIIVSATPIPGNEETVSETINNLFHLGADVVYSALEKGVHVSGHAGRDELKRMIDLAKPKYVIPVHGEYRHMSLYRDLAVESGIRRENVLLPEIGGVIEFTKNGASQKARVKAGNILVDRLGDRDAGQTVLRTRENLTEDGFVVVTIVLDRTNGELIAGPELVAKGLSKDANGSLKEAERELRRMLERRRQGAPQYGYVMQRAKEAVGKAIWRRSRKRPLILPVVTEL